MKASPAKARAARLNGRKGRAHGHKGGRPAKDLYLEDFAAVGDPPYDDPARLEDWVTKVASIEAKRVLAGRTTDMFNTRLNRQLKAIRASIPGHYRAALDKKMKARDEWKKKRHQVGAEAAKNVVPGAAKQRVYGRPPR